jgi:hypothetical protein
LLTSPIDFLQELLGAGGWPPRSGPALLCSLALISDLPKDVAQEQHRRPGQDDHCDDGFEAHKE